MNSYVSQYLASPSLLLYQPKVEVFIIKFLDKR